MASSDPQSDPHSDRRLLQLHAADNVVIARQAIAAGETVLLSGQQICLAAPVPIGHKLAREAIAPGGTVLKYGCPIGTATRAIAPGEHVHLHNVRSGYTRSISIGEQDA